MKLQQIAQWLGKSSLNAQMVNQFVIDSRLIKPGDVFVALPGVHCHGREFIQAAENLGAIAAITDKPCDQAKAIEQFVVKAPLEALTTLAKIHRDHVPCPTIALTGSNGKTTTKEMIYACLPKPSLATAGNFNNHIGVPLSVLRLRSEHHFAVFELGANHIGEIAETVAIAKPDVALINNIAPAHIEGFGSIDGVAKAKGEIYAGLADSGTAIINDDDDYHHFWDDIVEGKAVIRFSLNHPTDIYASHLQSDERGCCQFTLHFPNQQATQIQLSVPGKHMAANAVAAASCLYALNINIEHITKGLNQFSGVNGRFQNVPGMQHSIIINDTYNANLGSTQKAIETLAQYPGKTILIMGDMGELGEWTIPHHQQVGEIAKNHGIDAVFTLGEYSKETSKTFGPGGQHFKHIDQLIDHAKTVLSADTTLLVKGSRSARMERVVEALSDKETITNE